MTPVVAYVRLFAEKSHIERKIERKDISTYFPFAMEEALIKLGKESFIKQDDYILCPIYSNGTIQIGITGTIKYGETPEDAIGRELGEEVGIIPLSIENNLIVKKTSFLKNPRDFSVFHLYIGGAIPVPMYLSEARLFAEKDGIHKVGCYVYGEKDVMLTHLMAPEIYCYQNDDGIIGVALIPIKDLNDLL